MKNSTTIRMFCIDPTDTIRRGWHQVTLRKQVRNPNYYGGHGGEPATICENCASLGQADKGQVKNINGNNVSVDIARFSLKER